MNVALDSVLDCTGASHDSAGKLELVQWLAQLQVVDAWGQHHSSTRDFSSPSRKNRIDYIFASSVLIEELYHDSSYIDFPEKTAGDHRGVVLELKGTTQLLGKMYWRLQREVLHDHATVTWIRDEVSQLRTQVELHRRPDKLWQGWKKRISVELRRRSVELHSRLRRERQRHDRVLFHAQREFDHGRLTQVEMDVARQTHEHAQDLFQAFE